ncbi:hypothetical protein LB518_01015 [Mesorhizobium sp. BR1-1-16]|jgi:hypothetical protein|uniref:Uncharacterized protein n=1 Tax=Kaistia soli DSM 19436 TaxID=1122133 RepID=A0A1M4VMQ7_9HYPH|nr:MULTISPECIES: hypothetical protein [Hyphomicrobiales]MBZ9934860.1 hypothetical protein [Mesorhizobium sp. BR1-1-16]SHE70324.1 hypothetical protein SAMN02745157_0749 [Kaistia soli DSM 19436]HWJ71961.1 hypothetical protein [Kaistia sp.]
MDEERERVEIAEQKRAALAYLTEAWDEAVAEGIDTDIMAHAALFAALSDLIDTYGEDAVADLTVSLPDRVRRGEFTLLRTIQ